MFKRSFRQICHVVACNHLVSLISMTLPVAVQLLTSCCLSAGSSTWDAVVVGAAGHVGDSWFGNIPMKLPALQQMERFKKCGCTQLKSCRSVFDCVCFSWFFFVGRVGVQASWHPWWARSARSIHRGGNQGAGRYMIVAKTAVWECKRNDHLAEPQHSRWGIDSKISTTRQCGKIPTLHTETFLFPFFKDVSQKSCMFAMVRSNFFRPRLGKDIK